MSKRLYRTRKGRVLGGVVSGLGTYLDADPVLLRLLLVIGTIVTGGGLFIAYIAAWIIVPEEPAAGSAATYARDSVEDVRSRLAKSGAEMADAGARVTRDVVEAIRSVRTSPQGGADGAGASTEHGRTAASGGSREESGSTEVSNGARMLGFLLVAVGAIFLADKFFSVVFRSHITLPLVLIALGAVVIASGRGR